MRDASLVVMIVVAGLATGCGSGFVAASKKVASSVADGLAGGSASRNEDDAAKDDEAMRTINPTLADYAAKYFRATETVEPKKRVFRLTRKQFDITAKSLLPQNYSASITATFPKDPLQTNYEYSDVLTFSGANFSPYAAWVEKMVASVRSKPTTVINCAASDSNCLRTQATTWVTKALRGAVPAATISNYVNFFVNSVASEGLAGATADLVDVVLSSPHFVYREELATDAQNFLSAGQQLQNLTYTIADAPPEQVKLSSMSPAQYLQTPETVKAAVDTVLSTPESRDKLMRFFASWLEVKEADEYTISTNIFPEFTPTVAAAVTDEAKKFLSFHLSKAAPKLKDITQSTQSFVSQSIASIYGMSGNGLTGTSPVDLNKTQRLGIFSLPAVIASHSGPDTTRLVKRGVFFTRKVMCLEIGGVPSGVNTELPTGANLTERTKIETATNQATCLGCHSYINPFGFVQENYDPIGRWRTTDNNVPVDTRISTNFFDEGPVATDSPVEAFKSFTSSVRFKQCFVRQLFRFYMGRNEVPSDDPLLRKMFFYFAENDNQDILGLLQILAGSSRFSQRSEGGT